MLAVSGFVGAIEKWQAGFVCCQSLLPLRDNMPIIVRFFPDANCSWGIFQISRSTFRIAGSLPEAVQNLVSPLSRRDAIRAGKAPGGQGLDPESAKFLERTF